MSIRAIRRYVLAAIAVGAGAVLWAQESGNQVPLEPEWDGKVPSIYQKGDQTFHITLGTIIPLFYTDGQWNHVDNKTDLGGTGTLNYNYFFGPHFALGGEFGGMFSGTLGGNMLYIMPFGVKATYQFIRAPFEFPLSVMVGGATQSYLSTNYLGWIVKPGASVFWRYSPDWSFGLNAVYWWVPEWTGTPSTTVFGNYLEFSLTARYHF